MLPRQLPPGVIAHIPPVACSAVAHLSSSDRWAAKLLAPGIRLLIVARTGNYASTRSPQPDGPRSAVGLLAIARCDVRLVAAVFVGADGTETLFCHLLLHSSPLRLVLAALAQFCFEIGGAHMEDMPRQAILDRLQTITPDPNSAYYDDQVKVYNEVLKKAREIDRERGGPVEKPPTCNLPERIASISAAFDCTW